MREVYRSTFTLECSPNLSEQVQKDIIEIFNKYGSDFMDGFISWERKDSDN